MPRLTDDEKLAALEKRKAEIKAAQLKLARTIRGVQSHKKSQARRDSTRASIIIGAFCKEHAIRNPGSETQQVVRRGIERHIDLRPEDRHLFADLLALWGEPLLTPAPVPEAAE